MVAGILPSSSHALTQLAWSQHQPQRCLLRHQRGHCEEQGPILRSPVCPLWVGICKSCRWKWEGTDGLKANTIFAMRECRCRRVRKRLSTGEKTYFGGWEKGSHLFLAAATFIFGGS